MCTGQARLDRGGAVGERRFSSGQGRCVEQGGPHTSMVCGTAAPIMGCLSAARKKASRLDRNKKPFPLQRAMLSRSRPSTHAPLVTRPLSAAKRPRRFSSVCVAGHWGPDDSTTRGVKSYPPGSRKACWVTFFSTAAKPGIKPQRLRRPGQRMWMR